MAAKPTKSPVSFLKPKESTNNRTVNGVISNAISNLCKNFSTEAISTENSNNSNSSERTTTNTPNSTNCNEDKSTIIGKISNCDCTNISIMHLFHEMKQEFPTIPDEIVAQYVNENCHQREDCLKLLRTELALHPSPVQAYPAKLLQQLQQQQLPKKPLKVLRKSPVPPLSTTTNSTSNTSSNITTTSAVWPVTYSRLLKNEQTEQLNNNNNSNEHIEQQQNSLPESPRLRPTTLNLFTLPQQQQFRNVQLQLKEELQQRNQQQYQQIIEKANTPITPQRQTSKPIRRAPLPPLPPKPMHLQNITSTVKLSKGTTSDNMTTGICDISLLSPSTNKKSPVSSTESYNNMKSEFSPVRHRAVLHMPPPTKPGLHTLNSSPISPVNYVGQKSFTSVNLTLRQPVASIPQSTIDIVAGPGVTAAGSSGLTYSSTSYNALHGYQKTFNITVSDEGSEISASRIRSPNSAYGLNATTADQHSSLNDENSFKNEPRSLSACDYQDFVAILERQKSRRDKLAAALRENKNKLHQMEQKINILTEPVCSEETIKLDNEIQQLRTDCESMLNEIEFVRRLENNKEQQRIWQSRSTTQRDNNITPTDRTPTTVLSTPVYCQQQKYNTMKQHHMPYTPSEIDYTDSTSDDDDDDDDNALGENDDNEIDGVNEDEGILEMWACNMCTFRNHPQLNICECCENVRILPGTIRIVNATTATTTTTTATAIPTATSTTANALTNSNNSTNIGNNSNSIENNSNLTQLALHT